MMMKKRIGILSITVFTFIFLFTVISCSDPWSLFYLPDYIDDSRSSGFGDVTIIANGAPVTGNSLTTNYAGSDVKYQWVKINDSGTYNYIPAAQGGENSVFYPSEPGNYSVIITINNVPSPHSSPITIDGESITIAPITNTVTISGTGKSGEPLTAGLSPAFGGDIKYQWYLDGVLIPAPRGTDPELTPTSSGIYTVSASVGGSIPKKSEPRRVSDAGGLGTGIKLTNIDNETISPNLALNVLSSPATVSTTVTAAIEPATGGVTYQWFRPGEDTPATGATGAGNSVSPLLSLGIWTVRATGSGGLVRERQFPVTRGRLRGTFRIDGSGKVGEQLTAHYIHSTNPEQNGDPSFEWLRNGAPLSPAATGDTFIPTQAGEYSVRVRVEPAFDPRDSHTGPPTPPVHVGQGQSVIVDVSLVGGLRGNITFQQNIGFGNVTLPEDEPVSRDTPVTATYNLATGESGPFTYQWFKPLSNVLAGTSQTHTLDEVGYWTVKVTSPAPNLRTYERRIYVRANLEDTTIKITGSGQTATPNPANVPFAVTTTPLVASIAPLNPAAQFQWLRETSPGVYTPITAVTDNPSFTPTAAQTGNIIVQVTIPGFAPLSSSPPITVLNTQLDRGGLAGTVVFAPAMPNNAAYNEYNRTTTVTFTPGIGAVPPFTYEWFRPGENTPTAGSGADNRTSPTLAQLGSAPGLGWWRLVITDANGRVRERPFNVTLPNLAGTISINGSGRTGEQLIASYSGSELGDRTFEWYRNGAPLVPPETAIVAPGTTATIPGNRVEAGDYTVRVNIYGYNTLTNSPVVYVKPEGGLPVTVTFDPVSPGVNGPVQAILTPNRNGSYQWQRETSPTPTGSGTYTNATGSGATSATYTPNSIGWHKVIFTEDVTGRVIEETVKVLGRLTGGTITITGTGKPGEPLEADYIHGDQDGDVTFTWEREGPPGTWTTVSEDNPFTPTLEGNYRVVVWVEEYAPWWGGGSGIGIDRRGGLAGSLGVADGLTGRTTEASWQTTVAGPFTIFWYRPDGTLAESSVITNNSANGSPVLDIHGGPPEEEGWRVVVEGPNDRSREAYFNVIRTNHDVQFMAPGAIEPGNFTQFLNVPYGTVLSRTSNPPTAPATDPTRRGYTFDQWCSDTGLMNVFTIGVNSIRPLSQVVQIHARWNFAPGSLTIGGPGDAGTLGSAGTVFRIVPMVSDGGFFIIGSTQRYHYLEVSNNDRGVTHQWDTSAAPVQITPETLTGIYAGSQNTNRIIAASSNNPAAASTRPNGGFSGREDWFLPSIEELRALYNELSSAQRATLNLTGTYWSSSEASATQAWTFNMDNGAETPQSKGEVFKVRPIRAF